MVALTLLYLLEDLPQHNLGLLMPLPEAPCDHPTSNECLSVPIFVFHTLLASMGEHPSPEQSSLPWHGGNMTQARNQVWGPFKEFHQGQKETGLETWLQHIPAPRSTQEIGLEASYLPHRSRIPGDRAGHKHTYNTTQKDSECPGLSLNGAPGPWAGVWMGPR